MIALKPRRSSLLPGSLFLLGLASLLAGACAPTRPAPDGGSQSPLAGKPAPAFELDRLDHGKLALADLHGKVVLLDFWATWCKPCHEQTRILTPLYDELRAKGVEFLAVNSGEDEKTVQDFVAASPFAYPVLLDPTDSLSGPYDVQALPTLVVMDREGKVTLAQDGVADAAYIRQALAKAGA
jgi:cytochrome c biogenesis protein CcmG, thiol:disulfide interchange protein DsbE